VVAAAPSQLEGVRSGHTKPAYTIPPVFSLFLEYIARICKRLRRPEIDSEDSISSANVAWRTGTANSVDTPGIDSWAP
jgi:hypothetical protein